MKYPPEGKRLPAFDLYVNFEHDWFEISEQNALGLLHIKGQER